MVYSATSLYLETLFFQRSTLAHALWIPEGVSPCTLNLASRCNSNPDSKLHTQNSKLKTPHSKLRTQNSPSIFPTTN